MKTGAGEHAGKPPFRRRMALVLRGQCRSRVKKTMCRQRLMERQCHSFILPYAAFSPDPLLPPISAILMPARVARAEAKKAGT
jgi:hypothetical protein